MPGNTFGQVFRVTTFGVSHGIAVGCVIDGCPAGLPLDVDAIQQELDRRRPGQSALTTSRQEADKLELLSGTFDGITTGDPITLLIKNRDARSTDYSHLSTAYRPGHADLTYVLKYGIRDHRGGGRASARETAARVAAGAVARQLLSSVGVSINAFVQQVGPVQLTVPYQQLDLSATDKHPVRCPHPDTAHQMQAAIEAVRDQGDTLGGTIQCVASGVPAGLGEPVFDKLQAALAQAMMSLPATKGFEYGDGFAAAQYRGSQLEDPFQMEGDTIQSTYNRAGGILGGISTGEDIYFKVAFKPVSTRLQPRDGITATGETIQLPVKGRHDPCVVPRAVPIVEAMTALVLADHYLRQRSAHL